MKALNKYLIAAAALPVILGSASAFAHKGDQDRGPRDGKRPMMENCQFGGPQFAMKQLNLSQEQRDQIRTIRQTEHDQMRTEMKSLRAEEDKLLLSKDFSQQQAMALAKKMADERIEHRAHMLEVQHKILNVLTPEQKAKWSELRQQHPKDNGQCRPGKFKGDHHFDKGSKGPKGSGMPMDAPQPPMDE